MRVLMLGWDFSPRLSGGVGSACQGLANALARAPEALRTEVLFVLPRLRGDEEAENVRLLSGEQAGDGAEVRSTGSVEPPMSPREPPRTRAVTPEPPPPLPPTLPTPADALRLLEIDSPLRPYLSPS